MRMYWNLIYFQKSGDTTTYAPKVTAKYFINADGTWKSLLGTDTDNGSWVIETIPGSSTNSASTFYLYTSYYDQASKSIIYEEYIASISQGYMVMVMVDTSDPNDQDSIQNVYYFSK